MHYLEQRYQQEKERIYRTYDPSYNRYYPSPSPKWDYQYSYIDLMNASTPTKEIVPVNYKKFIIIGTSGAATHPTEHSTLADAEKEAERLSGNKPGEEFTIFETKKSYKIEKPKPVVKTFV